MISLRGGGGNFGVVTSFEYQLHPVGPLLAGLVIHPFDKAKEVLEFYRDFSSGIPDEVTTACVMVTSPEGHPAVAMVACYNGPIEAGEEFLRPLREFGPPLADQISTMSYVELQTMVDAMAIPGRQNYEKAHFVESISDGAIDTLISHFEKVTSPFSFVILQQTGGEMRRGAGDKAAYSHRDANYNFVIFTTWLDPGESEVHIRWARDYWEAMKPFTSGSVYMNDLGREVEEGADMMRAAYGANYQRLVALKNKYDPHNLFRHNQNIKPTV